jgi:hypothetical protein
MQAPRGLVPDAPVPGSECWYRLLTNTDHVTRDGTVHYQALKRGAFQPPPEQKPWAHELSGRMASLVANVSDDAETVIEDIRNRFVQQGKPLPSKICFAGLACAVSSELRTVTALDIATDVVYSPLLEDHAHSNFVTYNTAADEDLDPVRDWLRTILRVIKPQDVEVRIASCGQIPA